MEMGLPPECVNWWTGRQEIYLEWPLIKLVWELTFNLMKTPPFFVAHTLLAKISIPCKPMKFWYVGWAWSISVITKVTSNSSPAPITAVVGSTCVVKSVWCGFTLKEKVRSQFSQFVTLNLISMSPVMGTWIKRELPPTTSTWIPVQSQVQFRHVS